MTSLRYPWWWRWESYTQMPDGAEGFVLPFLTRWGAERYNEQMRRDFGGRIARLDCKLLVRRRPDVERRRMIRKWLAS